jgi:cyclomaltodextrinase / maltogenic alpha-amylase / neopullulanase
MRRAFGILLTLMIMNSCTENEKIPAFNEPPAWAQQAIWYQIFPERFCNGDSSNDPFPSSMQPGFDDSIPKDWKVSEWNGDWYKNPDWALKAKFSYDRAVQLRRYGGDIAGILKKLDYIEGLGVTAVYLNPMNDAPSLHKYDARYYHHIDVHFGNNPKKDLEMIAQENPVDPKSWVWTSADQMFLKLIEEFHKRGIKVILDFSWNHTGRDFWAFKDILKNGEDSKFKSWYDIKGFGDPNAEKVDIDYEGWFGIKHLPEIRKIKDTPKEFGKAYEGQMDPAAVAHIHAVASRWIDPRGDGSLKGIDGMRLDVAEHVPLGFWRSFRRYVRGINPSFYLVGECWWGEFPHKLMDLEPWLKGDVFDAVMHYHWYKPTRALFLNGDEKITTTQYIEHINAIYESYRPQTARALMNLTASHDSPRFWTCIGNTNIYKLQSRIWENNDYYVGKPHEKTIARGKAVLMQQFTFVGSPHIWNGDELGMYGGDDPDNRKPIWWSEFNFDPESIPFQKEKSITKPIMDGKLLSYYKSLIKLRNDHQSLASEYYNFDVAYAEDDILAYTRWNDVSVLLVMINPTELDKVIILKDEHQNKELVFINGVVDTKEDELVLGPFSGCIFKLK